MTIQLYLQYGVTGSLQFNFMGNGLRVMDGFYPQTALEGDLTTSDKFDLIIQGTRATVENQIRAINQAFQFARLNPKGAIGCWLYFAADGGATPWRTRVTNGITMLDGSMVQRLANNQMLAPIAIEHEPDWEGPEVSLPLTNGNGTNVTTGLTVYNCNDGSGSSPNKHHNYVHINAADVTGDTAGNTRIEVKNLYTDRLLHFWMGHNWTDPSNAVTILEAESATGATPTASANASGGYWVQCALTTNTEVNLLTWPLSTAMLNAARGQWVHGLIKFFLLTNGETHTQFRLTMKWNAQTIWQTNLVQPSADVSVAIRDLFVFQLPPAMQGLTSLDGINLTLSGLVDATSPANFVDIDYLALVPADGWRYDVCLGYGIPQNSRMMDDGILGYLYRDDGSGAGQVGLLNGFGNPIMLKPGMDQRLTFMTHTWNLWDDSNSIAESMSVKVYFRPRRKVL